MATTQYNTVVQLMRAAKTSATLPDYLHRAGLTKSPVDYRSTKLAITRDLMPGKRLAHLVGRAVVPEANRRTMERWARHLNLTPAANMETGNLSGHLYGPITRLVENSNRLPAGNARKLSDDVVDALQPLRDLNVNEAAAAAVVSAINTLVSDVRLLAISAEAGTAYRRLTEDTYAHYQAMLTHNAPAPGTPAAGTDDALRTH